MANTYTQLHIMAVFAVKHRHGLILPSWEDELYKYITGILQTRKHKMLQINGMPDHIHILFGLNPDESISDLIQEIKENSSKWINQQKFCRKRFAWQKGFGAFSYGHSQIDDVANYVLHQKEHHARQTFLHEYHQLLVKFGVEFNKEYIFKEPLG